MRALTVFALGLWLGACTLFHNPVTADRLALAESTYGVALTGAVAYRKLCADKVLARAQCGIIVATMQAADAKAQIALKNLRSFQKEHPEIDAVSLLLAVEKAIGDFKAVTDQHPVQ